jgi:hypothetical protein
MAETEVKKENYTGRQTPQWSVMLEKNEKKS